MSVKVNARIPDELAEKIARLRRRTKKPLTDVIVEALARYVDADESAAPRLTAYEIFERSGFIGIIKDGPSDLSVNYKKYVTEYLEKKYPR